MEASLSHLPGTSSRAGPVPVNACRTPALIFDPNERKCRPLPREPAARQESAWT